MAEEYPSWHPLSTVSQHADPCSCDGKPSPVVGQIAGAPCYVCTECGGYVP